jgi:hypothetical protein
MYFGWMLQPLMLLPNPEQLPLLPNRLMFPLLDFFADAAHHFRCHQIGHHHAATASILLIVATITGLIAAPGLAFATSSWKTAATSGGGPALMLLQMFSNFHFVTSPAKIKSHSMYVFVHPLSVTAIVSWTKVPRNSFKFMLDP